MTQAYFWPAVNKRQTRPWRGYFLTRPEEIFFDPKVKKMKNLTFLGEIFQTQTIDGWPNLIRVKIFWPGPITRFTEKERLNSKLASFIFISIFTMAWFESECHLSVCHTFIKLRLFVFTQWTTFGRVVEKCFLKTSAFPYCEKNVYLFLNKPL